MAEPLAIKLSNAVAKNVTFKASRTTEALPSSPARSRHREKPTTSGGIHRGHAAATLSMLFQQPAVLVAAMQLLMTHPIAAIPRMPRLSK
jgi:hypothetical protein